VIEQIEKGDIIIVATRAKRPVLKENKNFDDTAQLRVLGEVQDDEKILYLCLVTDGDAEHVNPTVTVGYKQIFDFDHDPRFNGCNGIVLSNIHIRGIAKKQRGRSCIKCTDYNEDAPLEPEHYLCSICRENPWR
jgi:hypothetical protein